MEFIGVRIYVVKSGWWDDAVILGYHPAIVVYTDDIPDYRKMAGAFTACLYSSALNKHKLYSTEKDARRYALKYIQHLLRPRPWAFVGIVPNNSSLDWIKRDTLCIPSYEVKRDPYNNGYRGIWHRVRINQLEIPT